MLAPSVLMDIRVKTEYQVIPVIADQKVWLANAVTEDREDLMDHQVNKAIKVLTDNRVSQVEMVDRASLVNVAIEDNQVKTIIETFKVTRIYFRYSR